MNTKTKIVISVILVSLAVLSRFLPHLWNFTAITAVALFAGYHLGPKFSVPIVILSMLISDLFIGFYDYQMMFVVYASFVLIGFIPVLFNRKKKGVKKIIGMSLVGSTIFFLITNWSVWYFGTLYPADFSGLFASFAAGLPFFRNALIGDLWYTAVFFGAYEFAFYLSKRYALKPKEILQRVRS